MLRSTVWATWRLELWSAVLAILVASTGVAQLQITEVLYNTIANPEPKWEWVEVRNASTTDVDLDGYFFDDDDGTALSAPNIVSIGSGGMASNTIVAAGGVAVLYNGSDLDFDNARFRAAWQLPPSAPLIAVDSPPGLANGGDVVGLWTADNYLLDIGDPDMTGMNSVQQFTNASATVDYSAMGFPGATNASIYWDGQGDYQDGMQWLVSMDGVEGATTSIETVIGGTAINSAQDIGNPGVRPLGPAATGLLISEIMYNPRSTEADWEWVEVYNNTGAEVDFSAVPHIFDDDDLGALMEANITSGTVDNGEVAVLYNADELTLQNVQDAWGSSVNFVPVTDWAGLGNSGDSFGIWNDFATYTMDKMNDVFDGAVTSVTYDNDPSTGWPDDDGNGSIYLTPLTADQNDGLSWLLSADGDTLSFNATEAIDSQQDNPGGDVGSPSVFGGVPPMVDGDFNNDGVWGCADIDALVGEIVALTNDPAFDMNGDGVVDPADITDEDTGWLAVGGANNPDDTGGNPFLSGDADLDGGVDVSDFNAWNENKFTSDNGWCGADFNADGDTDVSDFNIWNGRKFQSSGTAAVPEPAAALLLGTACGALMIVRRRKMQ